MSKGLAAVAFALILTGCSSVSSIHQPTDAIGLNYYMPKKDFLVTVTVKKKNITGISFGTTDAYPDTSQQYLLTHAGNVFGKNTLKVTINGSGLLGQADSKTVSQVTEALTVLGSSAGTMKLSSKEPVTPDSQKKNTCTTDGEHSFIFDAPDNLADTSDDNNKTICGTVTINIEKMWGTKVTHLVSHNMEPQKEKSGYYYRQTFPYKITASGEIHGAGIVFTPSPSPTYFLPVSKTFFSDNNSKITFSDGVPTNYSQDTDGEMVSLLKLPADILGAYFKALGETLSALKTSSDNEAALLKSELSLKIAEEKYRTCVTLLKNDEKDLFKELKCDQ